MQRKYYMWDYKSDSFNFFSDPAKCVHCKKCMEVCSTQILCEDPETGNIIFPTEEDGHVGWGGCYRCQRCFAVCPTGAITIFDRKPEDSVLPKEAATPKQLEALIRNRRSCRHFKDETVPREIIDEMLHILENVPTSSGMQNLEFSVVYDKEEMAKFRRYVRECAMDCAKKGVYPGVFGKDEFQNQLDIESGRCFGDVFTDNAPHMLIVHSKMNTGMWKVDLHLADAYWDLICASYGIGSLIMSLPVGVLNNVPESREVLGLAPDRHFDVIMGFGYPATEFARGVQRENRCKIHELKFPGLK